MVLLGSVEICHRVQRCQGLGYDGWFMPDSAVKIGQKFGFLVEVWSHILMETDP